jgi:hypothetical protein
MHVPSSPRTVASAEKIMEANAQPYFSPNKTMRELHDLMKSRAGTDPFKDFSEATREELRAFAASAGLPARTFPGTASLLVDARMLAA